MPKIITLKEVDGVMKKAVTVNSEKCQVIMPLCTHEWIWLDVTCQPIATRGEWASVCQSPYIIPSLQGRPTYHIPLTCKRSTEKQQGKPGLRLSFRSEHLSLLLQAVSPAIQFSRGFTLDLRQSRLAQGNSSLPSMRFPNEGGKQLQGCKDIDVRQTKFGNEKQNRIKINRHECICKYSLYLMLHGKLRRNIFSQKCVCLVCVCKPLCSTPPTCLPGSLNNE